MFIAKKIITSFILPPGIFILCLLAIGVYCALKKSSRMAVMNILLAFLLWASSIGPVADAMLRGLESRVGMPKNPRGDVIIILDGGIYDEASDLSGIGYPSDDTLARIVTGARLQKRLNVPVIVSGGTGVKHRKAGAPVIRRFLIDLGVPDNKIIIEMKSRDTIENAEFTAALCKRFGYEKPILVTSAFHMRRAVMSFEKVKLKVLPFPSHFNTWKNREYGWDDYLPSADRLAKVSVSMKEYIGLVFYRLVY